eukprot:1383249-Amorphochlora_amoeboformis.AAC.1
MTIVRGETGRHRFGNAWSRGLGKVSRDEGGLDTLLRKTNQTRTLAGVVNGQNDISSRSLGGVVQVPDRGGRFHDACTPREPEVQPMITSIPWNIRFDIR